MRNIISKNHLLDYLPDKIVAENIVNENRIFEVNNKKIKYGKIVYLMERELRAEDNFALNFAMLKSKELNLTLKIMHPKINYEEMSERNQNGVFDSRTSESKGRSPYETKNKNDFIENEIKKVEKDFKTLNFDFEFFKGDDISLLKYLKSIDTSVLVTDFNPIRNWNFLKNAEFKIYEIDGHNIIPARCVSDKQEYNAATFRRKVYLNIYEFLTDFPPTKVAKSAAHKQLEDFIENKLPDYSQFRNDPNKNVSSNLSKYLNLGFISAQRVALEVLKSSSDRINKEEFLEELIVRGELSDNFCLYNKDFKGFSGIPSWAKDTLNAHKGDFRPYLYSKKEFEQAKTHDDLWNAAQIQLLKEGKIHGYLRMYWAKKISEWSKTPEIALKIAIDLNDKYGYDAPSPNGYVGILWSIGALHDRAFAQRPVTGKIRTMTYNGAKSKFDVRKYIEKYLSNKV